MIVGANGMVGSSISRLLEKEGYKFVTCSTRLETNLLDVKQVSSMYSEAMPEYVFMCAGKVGGIKANNEQRVQFLEQNTLIALNTISHAHKNNVKRFIYLGSSCIYPKKAITPIHESALLTGPLEKTNEPYALSKIFGVKLCESYRTQYGADFISCMPCNVYGQGDNYNLETGHVMAAMIRKFHEAKEQSLSEVTFWGTGEPYREFIFADDLAEALVFIMNSKNSPEIVNIGAIQEYKINIIAKLVADIIGFKGEIKFDNTHLDGVYRKKVSISKISLLGWEPKTSLVKGIQETYRYYKNL